MPAFSRIFSRSISASVLALAITKSGFKAIIFSISGSRWEPTLTTSSPNCRSKLVHESLAAPTTSPPASSHSSVKLPISVTTLSWRSTVTVLPRSSVNVIPAASVCADSSSRLRASFSSFSSSIVLLDSPSLYSSVTGAALSATALACVSLSAHPCSTKTAASRGSIHFFIILASCYNSAFQ